MGESTQWFAHVVIESVKHLCHKKLVFHSFSVIHPCENINKVDYDYHHTLYLKVAVKNILWNIKDVNSNCGVALIPNGPP